MRTPIQILRRTICRADMASLFVLETHLRRRCLGCLMPDRVLRASVLKARQGAPGNTAEGR
jgi:hypothetical protein